MSTTIHANIDSSGKIVTSSSRNVTSNRLGIGRYVLRVLCCDLFYTFFVKPTEIPADPRAVRSVLVWPEIKKTIERVVVHVVDTVSLDELMMGDDGRPKWVTKTIDADSAFSIVMI